MIKLFFLSRISNICQVREKVFWTPRTVYSKHYPDSEVVVFKICTHVPSKTVLQAMLVALAQQRNKNLGIDNEHKPDRNWMVLAIATLDPQHEIFGKSYKPVMKLGLGVGPGVQINNQDGFFTGLPMLSSARDLKVKAMSCLSKEERLASQLAKEQAKIQRANQRMKDLASRVEEVKEGGRRADQRAELIQENQELRGKLAMKSRAVDELENFQVQG